jgi:dTDP-4-dehydrorhamnose 3,5-epimerase-like enzyme
VGRCYNAAATVPPVDRIPLTPKDLLEDAARDLTRQSYAPRAAIAGVQLSEVPVFRSPDGLFAELIRLDDGHEVQGVGEGFRPIQWNWSRLEPGAVKAWHLHLGQEDLWIVPPDSSLLVGLADLRRDSPTASAVQRLALGAGRCHRLLIPRGVAHGVANLGAQPQAMLYAVNRFFSPDPGETDEWRLPWDRFGAQFWEMGRG